MGLMHMTAKATDLFAKALRLHLRERYVAELDVNVGERLATAVSNHLLFRSPDDGDDKAFLTAHRSLVEEKARALGADRALCRLLSEAVRVQTLHRISCTRTSGMDEMLGMYDRCFEPIFRLMQYGVYDGDRLSAGFFARRRRLKRFINHAAAFHAQIRARASQQFTTGEPVGMSV